VRHPWRLRDRDGFRAPPSWVDQLHFTRENMFAAAQWHSPATAARSTHAQFLAESLHAGDGACATRPVLRLLELYARGEPAKYERPAIRWLGRLTLEKPNLLLRDVQLAAAELEALPTRREAALRLPGEISCEPGTATFQPRGALYSRGLSRTRPQPSPESPITKAHAVAHRGGTRARPDHPSRPSLSG
jgi:hypothetical protein